MQANRSSAFLTANTIRHHVVDDVDISHLSVITAGMSCGLPRRILLSSPASWGGLTNGQGRLFTQHRCGRQQTRLHTLYNLCSQQGTSLMLDPFAQIIRVQDTVSHGLLLMMLQDATTEFDWSNLGEPSREELRVGARELTATCTIKHPPPARIYLAESQSLCFGAVLMAVSWVCNPVPASGSRL